MLFNKKIEPSCSYCRYGNKMGEEEVICVKRGVVSSAGYCRKFSYDPLRREPPQPDVLPAAGFDSEDLLAELDENEIKAETCD